MPTQKKPSQASRLSSGLLLHRDVALSILNLSLNRSRNRDISLHLNRGLLNLDIHGSLGGLSLLGLDLFLSLALLLLLNGSGLLGGIPLDTHVDQGGGIVVDTEQHRTAILLGQHEVERLEALPEGKSHVLVEVGVGAIGFDAEDTASESEVADALANLVELGPLVVGDLGEHLNEQALERLLVLEHDDALGADVAVEDGHTLGLDTPAAHLGGGSVLLDVHLDTAVDELNATALVHDENVTHERAGVVDGLGRLAGGVADHVAVRGEAIRDLVEVGNVLNDVVVGGQVLEGLLSGALSLLLALWSSLALLGSLGGGLGSLLLDSWLLDSRGLLNGGDLLSLNLRLGLNLLNGGSRSLLDDNVLRLDSLVSLGLLLLSILSALSLLQGALGGLLLLLRPDLLGLSLELSLLVEDSDEETTGVLLVGVDAHAPLEREIGAVAGLGTGEHGLDQTVRGGTINSRLDVLLNLLPAVPDLAALVHDLPLAHTRLALEERKLVGAVDNLNLLGTTAALDGGGNDGLVLDGVHGAGGVDHATAGLEHLESTHKDADLGNVQTQSGSRSPVLPEVDVLPEGTVAGAGNIGQDTVELEVVGLGRVLRVGYPEGRVHGGIVVGDDHVGGRETLELMDQHVGSLVVGIVGNEHAGGSAVVAGVGLEAGGILIGAGNLVDGTAELLDDVTDSGLLAAVDHLKELSGLAAGGGAHVEDGHAGTKVHEKGRDHGDDLLAGDVADAGLGNQELLEGREGRELADDVLGGGHPPGELVGVPGHSLRGLDNGAIVGDLGNLGNVTGLEEVLDSDSVSVAEMVSKWMEFMEISDGQRARTR